jgi:hypothetical protein
VFVIFVVVVYLTRKVVVAPGWPLCRRCRADRVRVLLMSLGVLLAGVVGFFAGASLAGDGSSAGGLLFALGLIALVAGLVGISRATPQARARASVSRDGLFVEVREPHDRFRERLASH